MLRRARVRLICVGEPWSLGALHQEDFFMSIAAETYEVKKNLDGLKALSSELRGYL